MLATLLLAACGGAFEATISGTVVGLSGGTSVILLNNGADSTTVTSPSSAFTFKGTIKGGETYNVTVGEPPPAGETCKVDNGSGTVNANSGNVTNVTVNCIAIASIGGTVGGTISGLASGANVTLQNNATDNFTGPNGNFVFRTALANGATYSVTVFTQPSGGKTCSVSSGTGTMANSTNVTNVVIAC